MIMYILANEPAPKLKKKKQKKRTTTQTKDVLFIEVQFASYKRMRFGIMEWLHKDFF